MSTTSSTVSPRIVNEPREIPGAYGKRKEKISSLKRGGLVTPSGAKVPPAWSNVWVTTDPGSPLQPPAVIQKVGGCISIRPNIWVQPLRLNFHG